MAREERVDGDHENNIEYVSNFRRLNQVRYELNFYISLFSHYVCKYSIHWSLNWPIGLSADCCRLESARRYRN